MEMQEPEIRACIAQQGGWHVYYILCDCGWVVDGGCCVRVGAIACACMSVDERTMHACTQTNKHKNKTKQNKTKQNKTKQNKTKQNKTKQNKTEQNRTEQNKTKHKAQNTKRKTQNTKYKIQHKIQIQTTKQTQTKPRKDTKPYLHVGKPHLHKINHS
jgi:hypothetical protein